MLALFGAFPLWWALGLSSVIWILLAVPMLAWLLARGRVRVPKGFGLWLAFLFWMLLSATQLDEARRWYAFSYRAVLYLSMTVMFVYVYNLPRSAVPARRIILAMTLFWATVICFGFAALARPASGSPPRCRCCCPRAGRQPLRPGPVQRPPGPGPDLHRLRPARPAAPFTYTNEWGGAVGLLTPMALAGLGMLRSYLTRNVVRAAGRLPGPDRDLGQPRPLGRARGGPGVRGRPGGPARQRPGAGGHPRLPGRGRRPGRLHPAGPLRRRPPGPPAQQRAPREPRLPGAAGRWSGPCSATAGRGSRPTWSTPPRSAPTARSTWSSSPRASPAWPSSSAGGCGPCGSRAGGPPGRPCGAT